MPFTPYDAAGDSITRARDLLDGARPQRTKLAGAVRSDMRRLSVVMAVAALDTYLHRLVVERAYTHQELPRALARLDIPFERLLEQADETKQAARSKPYNSRPRVGVKRQLRDRLLRDTFQRYDDVGRALAMTGRRKIWEAVGQQMNPVLTPQQIQIQLDGVVTRRNQIVHEGDYKRLERPQTGTKNTISSSEARESIDFLATLIDAIHAVV